MLRRLVTSTLAIVLVSVAVIAGPPASAKAGPPGPYCHDLKGYAQLTCFGTESQFLADVQARTGQQLPTAAEARARAAQHQSPASQGGSGGRPTSLSPVLFHGSWCYVDLYEHIYYDGARVCIAYDYSDLGVIGWDNIASSSDWHAYWVRYYENTCACTTPWYYSASDIPDFRQVGFNMNDRISSIAHFP